MTHIKQIETNPDTVDLEQEISERQQRITQAKIGTLYQDTLTHEIERIKRFMCPQPADR